jgi:hypothetical protein
MRMKEETSCVFECEYLKPEFERFTLSLKKAVRTKREARRRENALKGLVGAERKPTAELVKLLANVN